MALSPLLLATKGTMFMEYLILAAVGAIMTLYAVIIFECLRHPEW
jgi:hypothetical protein